MYPGTYSPGAVPSPEGVVGMAVVPLLVRGPGPTGPRVWSGLQDNGQALADTDAQGRQSPTSAASTQFVGEGTDDACSGCNQGVADGDGSAVGVDDFGGQLFPAAYAGQGLGGEGFDAVDGGKVGRSALSTFPCHHHRTDRSAAGPVRVAQRDPAPGHA